MVLDLRRLQFLREVAARGTITAAAEALAYTPSAVSQQLAVLEREIGTQLLEPRGRSVALTEAGAALAVAADEVFAAVEHALTSVEATTGQVRGPVRVGAFQSVGAALVPDAFASLDADHPGLEVHLEQADVGGLRDLRLGHLDICIDQEYSTVAHTRHVGFEHRLLLVEPVYLAVAVGSDRGPDLARYADHVWAGAQDDDAGQLLRALWADAGVDPDVRYHTDDLEVTLQVVAAGLAVGILPRLAAYRMPKGVVVHPIEGTERRVKALWRPGSIDRPAVRVVLDHLERAGAGLGS